MHVPIFSIQENFISVVVALTMKDSSGEKIEKLKADSDKSSLLHSFILAVARLRVP